MIARLAALVCFVAVALTPAPAWSQRSATARETPPDELQQALDRGEKVLVIDVRTDEEVKTGSIPGAIHIAVDQLEARMKDVPRDVRLVFT
jgi:predicted sulfurtransferase